MAEDEAAKSVSFYKDIRPIVQAHCQGCHQPAKQGGAFVMTSFDALMKHGESEEASIVPGNPDASYLIEQINVTDGKALMPKGKAPLSQVEIDLIRRWVKEGAKNDTPENAVSHYDVKHPPKYSRPPVITSLDFSPNGELLAIAGFHEVLLRSADGEKLLGRLIGMSEKIESVAFSPDGTRLAVSGGNPGRTGELQVWNVAKQELELSIPITYDTLYGVSWSPDGKLIAAGCSDNTVRGFNSTTGEQVFFNGAHDDWPLDTVFSSKGTHIVSVGRDMSTKLYKVDTERFIDNVTSITPGALKGGLSALAIHPEEDIIAVAGSDGVPRLYRMERVTKRVIGDDANLMRKFDGLKGRLFDIAFSPDGKSIAAVSSLNGSGQVATYKAEVEFAMPENIKKIVAKRGQNGEEQKQLDAYLGKDKTPVTSNDLPAGLFAVTYRPDGKAIAVTGSDGLIRLINTTDGKIEKEFLPIDIAPESEMLASAAKAKLVREDDALVGEEKLPADATVTSIAVSPETIHLKNKFEYAQLLVTGTLNTGDKVDLTRLAKIESNSEDVVASSLGRVHANADGSAELAISFGEHKSKIAVKAEGFSSNEPINFVRDVNPILSRLGCNQGTCHGAKDGKNGFKLSLRGYDPIYDVRAFTDDHESRRINGASPDDSLMLLKATGAVPHVGGQVTKMGSPYYEVIRRWIAEGSKLNQEVEKVIGITIEPQKPVVQQIGARQQMRIIAEYSNGTKRDVTGEAYIDSGNTEVAAVNRSGVVTTLRRGEAPLLARFEGSYVATTLTAMGDRSGFEWKQPETWGPIDNMVASKWERMKLLPSGLCADEEFIRRVHLDLTGLPPSPEAVTAFVADDRPVQEKRNELIDKLIGSKDYTEYWTNKWADLLQVNRKFLGAQGAQLFRQWIREGVAANKPYDEFCYEILTATGSNKTNPAASYYKILREPTAMMENTTHLFLGVRFNCNKCHDHPFERWTQDQYYETAAYFAQTGLKRDPENKDGNIGGTAVEGAKPLWEVVFDKPAGEINHDRTGDVTAPLTPFDRELETPAEAPRREQLAKWITSAENDYFARSYVNRVWGYLLGVGLIEPLDDIRAGNPPSNPELLDYLTEEFVKSDFNVQHLMRMICQSRTYQLSVASHEWNAGDERNYSHAVPKRLPAEVLYDTVYSVTGSKMKIPGVPEGTRAAAVPDVGVKLTDGFLANLGRPVRESACECERSSDLQLGPVMALMNGPTVSDAISQPGNAIDTLVKTQPDNAEMVNQIFLRVLNRTARPQEVDAVRKLLDSLNAEHQALVGTLKSYEQEIAPAIAAKEQKRVDAIAAANKILADYRESIRPKQEADAKAREDRIAAAQKVLDEYLATAPTRQLEWEKSKLTAQTAWAPLEFTTLSTTNGSTLNKEADNIIFVTGPNNKKGAYVLATQTETTGITGIKLELLTDDRLGGRGPGRAANGNFVLSELTVEVWPVDKPKEKKVVKLHQAKADFSQASFDIATAIDGKAPNNANGWATAPRMGENRVATFELVEPLQFEGPMVISFNMNHQYQDSMHNIGKFRFSLTTDKTPVDFGYPKNILDIAAIAVEERNDEQKAAMLAYFNQQDPELGKKQKALTAAKAPVPVDPKLTELEAAVKDREKPIPQDPKLVRLKRAVGLSDQQQKNSRLTVAQDLTWALINSPAFLFNR